MVASSFDSERFAGAAVEDGLLEDRPLRDEPVVVEDDAVVAGVLVVVDVADAIVTGAVVCVGVAVAAGAALDVVADVLAVAAEPAVGTGVVAAERGAGVPAGVDAATAAASFNSLDGVEARESASLPLELVLSVFFGLAAAARRLDF